MFIEESPARLQLTPMIDVTFQLLIFFMVVSEISDRHKIESTIKQVSGGIGYVYGSTPYVSVLVTLGDSSIPGVP